MLLKRHFVKKPHYVKHQIKYNRRNSIFDENYQTYMLVTKMAKIYEWWYFS